MTFPLRKGPSGPPNTTSGGGESILAEGSVVSPSSQATVTLCEWDAAEGDFAMVQGATAQIQARAVSTLDELGSDLGYAASYIINALILFNGVTYEVVGQNENVIEGGLTTQAVIDISGSLVRLRVESEVAENISWEGIIVHLGKSDP